MTLSRPVGDPCKKPLSRHYALCLMGLSLLLPPAGCADDALDRQPPGVAKYVQAVAADRAGDSEGAMALYKAAIAENPSLRMAHGRLGDLYRDRDDYADAAHEYETASRLDPYSAELAYSLGLSYQFLHRLAEAAAAYLRALNLQPGNVRANMNLGLVYVALGKPADALPYLKKATQLSPASADAWSNYGVGLDAAGHLTEAQRAYEHALELDTGSPTTLQNLAANLIGQHKPREALAVCQQLLLRADNALTRTRMGEALALNGQRDEAMREFRIALRRDPRAYLAMSDEGFLLIQEYREGMELDEPKRESALALWGASLRINPDQPRVIEAVQQWQTSQLFGK
jgi:tetratricopeptide (TPR) repeat protein